MLEDLSEKVMDLARNVIETKARISIGKELLSKMVDKQPELKLAIESYQKELDKLLADAAESIDEFEKVLEKKQMELEEVKRERDLLIGKALIERALENDAEAKRFEDQAESLQNKIKSLEESVQSLRMVLRDIKEQARLELRCPKCKSAKISYTYLQQWGEIIALYKCQRCGHSWRE